MIRTLNLTVAEAAGSLALDIAANGWTRVRLTGPSARPLGADDLYDVVSRLMAAMSDPAQTTTNLGDLRVSLVMTLWEDHCTVWVERCGGNRRTLHVQDDQPGVNIVARVELSQEDRRRWRLELVDLLTWARQHEIL